MVEQRLTAIHTKKRANYNAYERFVAANDYLFAMTMKTLGCPDMPAYFGNDVTEHIDSISAQAELQIKQEEYNKNTIERHYHDQRGKDAKKLRPYHLDNRKSIMDKKAAAITVSNYAAEYHALKKRQEGHNAIWRFFHKKENKERNALLANMKKVLESAIGKDIEIDDSTPVQIAESYSKQIIAGSSKETFKEDAISKRCQFPNAFFKHEATLNERALNDKEDSLSEIATDLPREHVQFGNGAFEEYTEGNKDIDRSSRIQEESTAEKNNQISIS